MTQDLSSLLITTFSCFCLHWRSHESFLFVERIENRDGPGWFWFLISVAAFIKLGYVKSLVSLGSDLPHCSPESVCFAVVQIKDVCLIRTHKPMESLFNTFCFLLLI